MAESPLASGTPGSNQLWRFLFDGVPVRGALVRIDAQWRDLLAHRPYPDNVRELLGEAMAAAPLLASNLKFAGKLTLQAEGEGPIKLLLVHITHDFEMRGTARHEGETTGDGLALLGGGRLGLIFEPAQQGSRYHAMVPLVGRNLEESLTHYFRQSEQLPTWLRLYASESGLAGLMLQRLPAPQSATEEIEEGWHRLCLLADTLQTAELIGLEEPRLLRRLFHQEALQLFEPQPVVLRCRCSHGRISEMLLNLGRVEVESILAEQGQVEIECGFCGKQYRYDAAEVTQLFAASDSAPGSELRH
jgi:molecular chaperone Hsp33